MAKIASGLLFGNGMRLDLTYSYRMFLNYMAKPNRFTTEISTLRMHLQQRLSDNLALACRVSYADNANDNGIATIGLNKTDASIQLEYRFQKLLGE